MLTEQQKWDRLVKRLFSPVTKDCVSRIKITDIPNQDELIKLLGDKLIEAITEGSEAICKFKKNGSVKQFTDISLRIVLLRAYLEISIDRVDAPDASDY